MKNQIEFSVYGRRALFTDPVTKVGGEKFSYPVPTYEALKGICESIYWKPTIIWYVDSVRIMKRIRNESVSIKNLNYGGGNDLSIYSYLSGVDYHVRAHFEWNMNREDLAKDRNENKHYFQAVRALERGGRRDIFLGTRKCQAYVVPCSFEDGKGDYDQTGSVTFGLMFHGFDYADETGTNGLDVRFWTPMMTDGIIDYIRPEMCQIRKHIYSYHRATSLLTWRLKNELDGGARQNL
ncbi:type I-C CRISPR-associated protein Cas5 [Candidatus Methanomethylophilus sp. 1R26]|uniref:type I-C CRISPR-associated protein Cas5c n=1 Tax=Candidatus Methanomethylophilus sp. 1R26 TaxID=1769296 RepID=UPI000736C910|nr:type I-C CRISPR-associated protein Cas5c [Candidatus Methanomethylophilus sp. 1R26]KUE74388.1 type I-C CRISPR-associated protein Cas5 [Candidatus Methanomethylophilus sp. 1R26]